MAPLSDTYRTIVTNFTSKSLRDRLRRFAADASLENTQMSDLSQLAGMKRMKAIYLRYTQVSDLSPLVGMNGMQKLDLRPTRNRRLIFAIGFDVKELPRNKSERQLANAVEMATMMAGNNAKEGNRNEPAQNLDRTM